MNQATMEYIVKTVYATNILPVISNCNTSCSFCSHKQNPEKIEVFKMPDLSIPDFSQIIEFLSSDSKIIIGESATRIIEGEPLLYKNIVPLLRLVRKKYPKTQIQLTTNGIMLNDKIITELTGLGGIELGISVNCLDPVKRKAILGSAQRQDIRDTIMLLKDKIPFSLSSVYVPDKMDSSDIYELVSFSSQSGAMMLKIYLPGVTSKSDILYPLDSTYHEVESIVQNALKSYELPVVIEPTFISDLRSNVVGVIKNTPAFLAGIRRNDQVLLVNDRKVRSRVEAFSASYRAANPELTILRDENVIKVRLQKNRNTSPGFVMHYDIDPEIIHRIENIAAVNKSRKVLFVTSFLAYDLLKALFETSGFNFEYQIIKAQNSFFGGNISCAGLLTAEDIIKASRDYLSHYEAPDIIILPPIMFDGRRRDLLGRSIEDISMELGIPVETSS